MIPSALIRALVPARNLLEIEATDELAAGDAATQADVALLLRGMLRVVEAQAEPSPRDRRILDLTGAGRSDPEVAAELGVSARTVRRVRGAAGRQRGPLPGRIRGGEARIAALRDEGLSAEEICAETGWSERTVREYLDRLPAV